MCAAARAVSRRAFVVAYVNTSDDVKGPEFEIDAPSRTRAGGREHECAAVSPARPISGEIRRLENHVKIIALGKGPCEIA